MAVTNRTKRLFGVLWVLGMAGVLSFLLVDLEALIAMMPLPADQKTDLPPWYFLKLASVAQPAILVTVAVIVGMWLAPKVGLRSPASEALAEGRSVMPELRPQILPGIVAGILSGIAIVACWLMFRPFLDPEFVARSEGFNKLIPAAMRFLYGGLTEEILLRWGMMTFLVWLIWRLFGRGSESPAGWTFAANVIRSSVRRRASSDRVTTRWGTDLSALALRDNRELDLRYRRGLPLLAARSGVRNDRAHLRSCSTFVGNETRLVSADILRFSG